MHNEMKIEITVDQFKVIADKFKGGRRGMSIYADYGQSTGCIAIEHGVNRTTVDPFGRCWVVKKPTCTSAMEA